ncbi:MAG: J domain-containing protein [Pseudomonadota bacterium]
MTPTHYDILGVERDASAQDITAAYRRLVSQLHPDRHPDDKAGEETIKAVNRAYEVLSEPKRRKGYDASLRGRPVKRPQTPGGEEEPHGPTTPYHQPGYPASAAVNARPTMTYDEAMEAKERRELRKAVLTEQGWVMAID